MLSAFTIPILGRIENFWIIFALIIGSAIWEWIKRRSQSHDTGPDESQSPRRTTTTPPAATPRPAATSDWEAELRRLLGGEAPEPRPPPALPPPVRPIIIQEPHPRPVVAAPPAARTFPPRLASSRIERAERSVEVQLPTLKESTTAYQRASHLHEGVTERLKRVEDMTERHQASVPVAHRRPLSAEAIQTISLIRRPATVRQAVIASLIFGPPKALEGE